MRRSPRDRGDARRLRLARPEILGVQAVTCNPPACKAADETAHKRGWTTDVEVRIAANAHFLEHGHADAPHPVEIDSRPIGWLWRTVTLLQQCIRKRVVIPIDYDSDFRC